MQRLPVSRWQIHLGHRARRECLPHERQHVLGAPAPPPLRPDPHVNPLGHQTPTRVLTRLVHIGLSRPASFSMPTISASLDLRPTWASAVAYPQQALIAAPLSEMLHWD